MRQILSNQECSNVSLRLSKCVPVDKATGSLCEKEKRTEFLTNVATTRLSQSDAFIKEWESQMMILPNTRLLEFENISPVVVGMGEQHVFEVGLTLHKISGRPVLPGSGLKGLVRREAMSRLKLTSVSRKYPQMFSPDISRSELKTMFSSTSHNEEEIEELLNMFGSTESTGLFDVFDGLLTSGSTSVFMVDTMTPHYGQYYRSAGNRGADGKEDPVPVSFLSVRPGNRWKIPIRAGSKEWADVLESLVCDSLISRGAGAKTSSGFGRFRRK